MFMKPYVVSALICLLWALPVSAAFANSDSVLGSWLTFDGDKPESRVEVTEVDGEINAAIVEIFEPADQTALCERCSGELKGKPVLGMQIVSAMTLQDGVWRGGRILDPKTGRSYKCEITVKDGELHLKAWWGFLSETRQWRRAAL